jgi:hypothetical protein
MIPGGLAQFFFVEPTDPILIEAPLRVKTAE